MDPSAMDPNDVAALKGLIWLIIIGWWIWPRARVSQQPSKDARIRSTDSGSDQRGDAHYTCAPTAKDRILVGVRRRRA